MTEFLVLITGFMSGLRIWLGVYDMFVAHRLKNTERMRKVFLSLGRFGTAVGFGTLTFALASPGTQQNALLGLYIFGAILMLVGSVGELSLYEWREGERDPLNERDLIEKLEERKANGA